MFKWIKRFFGLDYNDNAPAAETHSGIGYTGLPNLAERPVTRPAVEDKGEILIPTIGGTRPAVEDKGTLPLPAKKPAKKAAPKKAAPKKAAKKAK